MEQEEECSERTKLIWRRDLVLVPGWVLDLRMVVWVVGRV